MKRSLLAALIVLGVVAGAGCNPKPRFENPRVYDVADLNTKIGPSYKVTTHDGCDVPQVHDQRTVLTDEASLEAIVELFSDVHDGRVQDIGDGFVEVGIDPEALEGSGTSMEARVLAAREGGWTAMLNLLYFLQPQGVFYPVDQAKKSPDKQGHSPSLSGTGQEAGPAPNPVVTIDTGHVAGDQASGLAYRTASGLGPNYTVDGATPDGSTGHGPAIADLIGRLIADSDQSQLVNVHPVETADMGHGPIRAFTASALHQTLNEVSKIIGDAPVTINMSFGAKACEEFLYHSESVEDREGINDHVRIEDVVYDWIADHPQVTVVAAAGNSGTNTRTYPAGWSDDPVIGHQVIAVGALGPDGNRSCYSDWGTWVDVYAEGDEVWVGHPTMGDVVWSGTSFAAPQVAAGVALYGPQQGLLAAAGVVSGSPPTPTGKHMDQCVNL